MRPSSPALAAKASASYSVRLIDEMPAQLDSAQEVLAGLRGERKAIAPKYFYDEQGSRLFDQITRLPEYYLTRTEIGILRRHLGEVAEIVAQASDRPEQGSLLLECGSGSGEKARILIECLSPSAFVGIDISRDYLVTSTEELLVDFPHLDVYAVCADYSKTWRLPESVSSMSPKLAFFPGSSLGNFEPGEAIRFLATVRDAVGAGGHLLIGIDPPKERHLLEAAYNDDQGITAKFNLNLLSHLNRTLDADFSLDDFSHEAVYNEWLQRIEMYLVSRRQHVVRVADTPIVFAEGERVHTENSYKYSYDAFLKLAWRAGFARAYHWSDSADLFSVFLLRV